jgi:hypothetical protein
MQGGSALGLETCCTWQYWKFREGLFWEGVTLQRLDEEDWEDPGVFFFTKRNFLLNPLPKVKSICRFLSFCAFLMASS